MPDFDIACLNNCLTRYQRDIPELKNLAGSLQYDSVDVLIDLYHQCYPLLERAMWSDSGKFSELLDCYQSLFREQEALIQRAGDERYHFILSIPVADRPAHLRICMESIYQQ